MNHPESTDEQVESAVTPPDSTAAPRAAESAAEERNTLFEQELREKVNRWSSFRASEELRRQSYAYNETNATPDQVLDAISSSLGVWMGVVSQYKKEMTPGQRKTYELLLSACDEITADIGYAQREARTFGSVDMIALMWKAWRSKATDKFLEAMWKCVPPRVAKSGD
ncbi:MAG: hypothetical protein G01um101425_273 [Candidatus Peregrinibacteria bacterium Gr01-1014_25]|nr:MAG: hypothetical protein G01um101425_273 [Candidatus Peregrinibacteria bacterium Gr01-1014_25]